MKSFGSLSLGSRLKRLSDQLVQDVVEIYQANDIDLNPTYFPLFNLTYQYQSVSVTEAAEKLGVSHPAISKIARKMINEGWLSRVPDPEDDRRSLLMLSEQSEQLLERIQPVWVEIKQHLDFIMSQQQQSLLTSLSEFEGLIEQYGFVQPVLNRLSHQSDRETIEILGWSGSLREDFKRLNMNWLDEFFDGELIDLDVEALNNPEGYYLSKGGYIWFARYRQRIVGCVALARHPSGLFEISKMGVENEVQGGGVGRELILTALNKARELGAHQVYLETSHKLKRALKLYHNVGFQEVSHPQGQSVYPRSDIYMILTL